MKGSVGMGIYLNPGNKGFWESLRSRIYVDKTNLIACTNAFVNTRIIKPRWRQYSSLKTGITHRHLRVTMARFYLLA